MKNVGGVFIVLCSGVGVAAILALLEMFWKLWKTSSKEKVLYENTLAYLYVGTGTIKVIIVSLKHHN